MKYGSARGTKWTGRSIPECRPTRRRWKSVEPVYEIFPGWKQSTSACRRASDLPRHARRYLQAVAEICEAPIGIVSIGPKRDEILYLK
jgi:adenylosuccinate synthase